MQNSMFLVIITCLVLSLSACSGLTTDQASQDDILLSEQDATAAIASDSSVEDMLNENQDVHGDADDHTWDAGKEVLITLDGDTTGSCRSKR